MDAGGSAMQGRETDGSERPRASHADPLSTCYLGNLSHRSVCPRTRLTCPSCPLPPCLVRVLNEPFMQKFSSRGVVGAVWCGVSQWRLVPEFQIQISVSNTSE
eukprot:6546408-Prymnesium_polylepis.1